MGGASADASQAQQGVGAGNYWLWGPRGATGEVLIIVGGRRTDAHEDFRSVVLADTTQCDHCMPFENGAAHPYLP